MCFAAGGGGLETGLATPLKVRGRAWHSQNTEKPEAGARSGWLLPGLAFIW